MAGLEGTRDAPSRVGTHLWEMLDQPLHLNSHVCAEHLFLKNFMSSDLITKSTFFQFQYQ